MRPRIAISIALFSMKHRFSLVRIFCVCMKSRKNFNGLLGHFCVGCFSDVRYLLCLRFMTFALVKTWLHSRGLYFSNPRVHKGVSLLWPSNRRKPNCVRVGLFIWGSYSQLGNTFTIEFMNSVRVREAMGSVISKIMVQPHLSSFKLWDLSFKDLKMAF